MNDYCWSIDLSPSYLSHYGVLGMKWGVRRYQNGDGSYNTAGEARYRNRDHGDGPAEHHRSDSKGSVAVRKLATMGKSVKAKVSDAYHSKVRSKEDPNKQVYTKHKSGLVAKYMEQGMSKKDAEEAADKKINTERAIGAAAAVAVATAVTYVAVQKHNDYTKGMDLDVPMQRIVKNGDELNLGQYTSYASYDPRDKVKYGGIYGSSLRGKSVVAAREDIASSQLAGYWKSQGLSDEQARSRALDEIHTVYKRHGNDLDASRTPLSAERANAVKAAWASAKEQTAKMNLNPDKVEFRKVGGTHVAPDKAARETFAKLFANDKEFRDDVERTALEGSYEWGKNASGGKKREAQYKALFEANEGSSYKDLTGKVYNAFNTNITTKSMHGDAGDRIISKYSAELKKQGYDAIQDYNDKYQSRYKARNPIIMMPDKDAQYEIINRHTMSNDELNSQKAIGGFMIGSGSKEATAGLIGVAAGFTLKAIHDTRPTSEGSKSVAKIAQLDSRNARIKSMRRSGKSISEIADALNIPEGTVSSVLSEE